MFGGEFHDGLLLVRDSLGQRFIDKFGATVLRPDALMANDFSEGLAAAAQESGNPRRDKWGFIDRTGRFVVEPKFRGVSSFSEGLARVSVDGEFGSTGYIDKFGNFVIPPRLSTGSSFHEGLAAVILDGPCRIINGGSCSRAEYRPATPSANYDCKFSFIDKTGRPISDLRFDDASDFSEGLAPVRLRGKWGYVDKSGRIAIEPQFEVASAFSEGLASVRSEGGYGFIDHSGGFVIRPSFKFVECFSDGRALVYELDENKAEVYHFIDRTGAPAFPAVYTIAASFRHGLAPVVLDGPPRSARQLAWINTAGQIVFRFSEK